MEFARFSELMTFAAPNMQLKPVAIAPSDVPLHASFANGVAILSQTLRSVPRRLTRCYVSLATIIALYSNR